MLEVKTGIMWMAIFIALAIVALFVGGAYSMAAVLIVLVVAFFIGFSCILIVLGEIRDALAHATKGICLDVPENEE